MSTERKLKILFIPLDGYGHINACAGIAEKLISRGHQVTFALERAWKGKASQYSDIKEILFVDKTRNSNHGANDHWIEFMDNFKKQFPLEPFDALKATNVELEEQFLYTLINVDDELTAIIAEYKPDVIVCDTYVTIPAVIKSGIPWVWLTSAAPLISLPSDDLPPSRTGFPTDGDRTIWAEFRALEMQIMEPMGRRFIQRLKQDFDLDPPPPGMVMHPSPYLNMYAYPEELDYLDIRPLPNKTWRRFDHFIRQTESDSTFKIPDEFLQQNLGKLVYVSMGSMGCADYDLMKRLIDILSKSPNRFIFSLGPLADRLKPLFGSNMFGERFVPQTSVLPLVDLVISHGGNNTFIETLYFGKPILITPLFADQLDNAQRAKEKGYGNRVQPYTCEPQELLDMVEQLLNDQALKKRVEQLSKRLQSSNSTENAAKAIENLAAEN